MNAWTFNLSADKSLWETDLLLVYTVQDAGCIVYKLQTIIRLKIYNNFHRSNSQSNPALQSTALEQTSFQLTKVEKACIGY